jgi:hypothetical protein
MNRVDFEQLMKEKHRYATLLEKAIAEQNDMAVRAVALKIARVGALLREEEDKKKKDKKSPGKIRKSPPL